MGQNAIRYLCFGTAFGVFFPAFGTLLEAHLAGGIEVARLVEIQRSSPLLWIIDTAPFFLGVFALAAGVKQDRVAESLRALADTHAALQATLARAQDASNRLEKALAAKGEFLAKMSHELRTPLNVILGFSRILQNRHGDKLPERAQTHLTMVIDAGEHLLSLVNDMLDIEKIESGRLAVTIKPVAVRELLSTVYDSLSPALSAGGYDSELVVDDDTCVLADRDRLRQILTNLVNNAIKYAGRGKITVGARASADSVTFFVQDTGAGIPPQHLARIFEPFHQVDGSSTRSKDGAGLGLSIVKRLTELMNGSVSVTSALDEGTAFSVVLPRAVTAVSAIARADARVSGAPAGRSVLVIDDNPALLELVRHELEDAGYSVALAATGEEGLHLAERLRPDVIVLDIVMPGFDGWHVLRRLRASPSIAHTPVVVASMLDPDPAVRERGIAGWLTKPFGKSELAATLSDAISPKCRDVLVVEDDARTQAMIKEALSRVAGINVTAVATKADALIAIEERLPCVLILDLDLPDGSGLDVAQAVRARTPQTPLAIVVYTARSDALRDDVGGFLALIEKHDSAGLERLVDTVRRASAAAPGGAK